MFVEFFIRRPVFATVCALLIVLGGAISIPTLPIALYPDLAPPQVVVTSTYTGANAESVESAVTTPLEEEVNGVEGMRYISSTSGNNGLSTITVTFKLGRDLDLAAVDVQNRVATALPALPDEVKRTGVTVTKSSTAIVLAIGLSSEHDRYSNLFISNYADVYLRDALRRLPGVSEVRIFGERRYAMRLWLDPARLAARGLTASDVVKALGDQNLEIAAGNVGQPPAPSGQTYQISVRAIGRLSDPKQFEEIVLKSGTDGRLVKVKDVGTVQLGAEDYSSDLRFDRRTAVGLGIFQLPDANALQVDQEVRAELARLAREFPPGLTYKVAFDTTTVIGESIDEVLKTLVIAILLVIAVIFVFLGTWRSTVIPAITIPVSLIGTFIFVRAFGFSINTLTLFGLTLATGLVVDDAIVVIENVERHLEEGAPGPRRATSAAMREVTGAVIATSLVLIAVFVPVALFPGTTGRLYVQFALTIAFSIALSAFNALTLSPALAALLLRPRDKERPPWRPLAWFGRRMKRLGERYHHALGHVMRHKWIPVTVFVLGLVATAFVYRLVPSAFVPDEDQGYVIINLQAPDGVSLAYTEKVAEQAEKVLFQQEEVADVFSVVGFSFTGASSSTALLFVNLRPFGERKGRAHSALALVDRLRRPLGAITSALVVPFVPPAIRGIGNFGGFQYELQDRQRGPLAGLAQATQQMVGTGNRDRRLRGLFSSFTVNAPQLHLEIDRDRALSLGVPISDIASALQVTLGSFYVNDFNFNDRVYRVYVQGAPQSRSNPAAIDRLYVRSTRSGAMVPLEGLVHVTPATTPQVIYHFDLFRAAEINGAAAPGVSSGQALAKMAELSRRLPSGMGYQWSGLALEEIEAGSQSLYLFALGVLVVFLVLAAQYESFTLPFTVLLSVPLAILGALSAQWLRGLQNDVYCQVGLVMLVGLAAKNAILIVEFAEQLRESGLSVVEAAIEAAAIRLRPILMTSLAFILGVLPLVFALGAGSASRHSLGTTVLGGMVVSSLLNLFLIPVLYVIVEGLRLKLKRKPKSETAPEGT